MYTYQFTIDNTVYNVDGGQLTINRNGIELAAMLIAPIIDDHETAISKWSQQDSDHYVAEVAQDTQVHFAVKHGRPCYWMQTTQRFVRRLTYFTQGVFYGGAWHSFIPDEWDRTWDCRRDVEVAASSNYMGPYNVDGSDGAGMTDPGDRPPSWIFNIPAHHCAFKGTDTQWLGICMPHPHAIGTVRYRMDRLRFSMTYEAVQASCEQGTCPIVYFESGFTEPYQLCQRHYALSESLGLTRKNASEDHPDWWSHSYYKSYDDQLRMEKSEGGFAGHQKLVDGELHSVVTAERIKQWHGLIEEKTGLAGKINLFFDQIYFHHYGGYDKVNVDLGGVQGFRELIDNYRDRGVHTGLYFHPYTCSKDADFFKQHPQACLATNSRGIEYRHGVSVGSSGSVYFDWTHPKTREFLLDTIEFLLSDKPGCLNADWLGINNTYGPDPRYYQFHDPDWGVGDLMQLKVQKLLYEKAKSIKPDCMVRRQSALAPFMEPYYDESELAEEWNGSTRAWWQRARIATRLIRNNITGFDAWFVTLTKAYEYFHGLAVVTVPATYASTHTIHPYMKYRLLEEKDLRRRKAGMLAYMNAPQRLSDDKHVELTDEDSFVTAWRKRTQGPLAGFYAALAISPRCQVTYSETQAIISASENRTADIPLPPNAKLDKVERVRHDGAIEKHEYEMLDEQTLRTHVEDAQSDTLYVQIRYTLH